jgi:hypothetical protein
MDKYNTIDINDKSYYLATDIYDFSSEFFYGCRNVIRNIIIKKKIPKDDIL